MSTKLVQKQQTQTPSGQDTTPAGPGATRTKQSVQALGGYDAQQAALSPSVQQSAAPAAADASIGTARVSEWLNVRSGPSSKAAKVGVLGPGSEHRVIGGTAGSWLKIEHQGGAGHIYPGRSSEFATFVPKPEQAPPSEMVGPPAPTTEQSADSSASESEGGGLMSPGETLRFWLGVGKGVGGGISTALGLGARRTETKPEDAPPEVTERAPEQSDLEKLMAKDRLTTAEIATARTLIGQEPAEKQPDLFQQLQSKVPYDNQRDNESTGEGKDGGTCNLTSLAMCLSYLGVANPHPEMQFADALDKVRIDNNLPARTTAGGWGGVAEKLGVSYSFVSSANSTHDKQWWIDNVQPKLQGGEAVMMSIGGHIVRVEAVATDGLKVDDPYGKCKLKAGTGSAGRKWEQINGGYNTGYTPGVINEDNHAGEDVVWPWADVEVHEMKWVASFSK